jgi:hypothetical protein
MAEAIAARQTLRFSPRSHEDLKIAAPSRRFGVRPAIVHYIARPHQWVVPAANKAG